MAVLAMDQYAHFIADRLAGSRVVAHRDAVAPALQARQVPVLAPFQWMREADPLPHSWDVTSDSIAAWIAGELAARRLVLVKPAGTHQRGDNGVGLVDAHFSRAIPTGVELVIAGADQRGALW